MTLEIRMLNILRGTVIRAPKGIYRSALTRLVKKGDAVRKGSEYKLAPTLN